MSGAELYELTERIRRLPVADQLTLIGQIAGGIRRDHSTDHEAEARDWAAFVAEWVAQGGEKYPYPVPPEHAVEETPVASR